MDSVKIVLQNKELIEEIIKNSDNLELAVHNAILDGVSKRMLKTVMNNNDVVKRILEVKKDTEEEISKKYFNKEKSNWGYSSVYTLKPEYQKIIDKAVDDTFKKKLKDKIIEITNDVTTPYVKEFNKILKDWVEQIKNYDLDELAKKAINDAVEKRFGKQ